MRILHWNESWRPLIGGTEVLLQHLATEQRRRGHALAVITDRAHDRLEPEETTEGVAIHRLPLKRALLSGAPADLRAASEAVAAVRRSFRPEVVHLHVNGPSVWFHLLTQPVHPAPTLVTLHTPFRELAVPRPLLARLLGSAAWITTVSHALLAELHVLFPETRARSGVVWNALPSPVLAPAPLASAPPVLLAAGRLVPEKGFDTAIRALARLRPVFPAARLVIAGDGPERDALARLADELLPTGCVTFLGWVDPARIPAVINDATLLLMPSRWQEPFGLVALQAAQMGRPIVASAVGGLVEIVVDGVTGRLVPPDDPTAMAAAAAALLADPAAAARCGAAARERAEARFSLAGCADGYDALYARQITAAAPGVFAAPRPAPPA